jgi:hypothetical protein
LHSKSCRNCNQVFRTTRRNQRFCDHWCASGYQKRLYRTLKTVIRRCQFCGSIFETTDKDRKYCVERKVLSGGSLADSCSEQAWRRKSRETARRATLKLKDSYVRNLVLGSSTFFGAKNVPPEIIEQKRKVLRLIRLKRLRTRIALLENKMTTTTEGN